MAAAQIDNEQLDPRVLADLYAMREQLSTIEAALPDYGPSFSALEQQVQQIKVAIDKVSASPSVTLTAAQHASKSAHAISEILAPALAKLQKASESAELQHTELSRLMDAIHVRSMYRPFPWIWPAVALLLGFWLYPLVAAIAPGGTNLAALAAGHRDRWVAGGSLMHAHYPEAWAEITRTSQILAENRDTFSRCIVAADRANARHACTIHVWPTAGQK